MTETDPPTATVLDQADQADQPELRELPVPPWRTELQRRPRRGPAPQLDRERIVRRALEIIDAGGIAALSLRRLAEDLGVTPMSLYWHVADKAELLDLVGQAVLAEIALPPRAGDWKAQLRDVHHAMRDAFLRHPNAGELMIGRGRFGAGGLMTFERILEILLEAGFAPEAAFDAYETLYLSVLGFMATSSRTPEFLAIQRAGAGYMLTLHEDRFPAIRRVVPVMGRRSPEERFELALTAALDGLEVRLEASRGRVAG